MSTSAHVRVHVTCNKHGDDENSCSYRTFSWKSGFRCILAYISDIATIVQIGSDGVRRKISSCSIACIDGIAR